MLFFPCGRKVGPRRTICQERGGLTIRRAESDSRMAISAREIPRTSAREHVLTVREKREDYPPCARANGWGERAKARRTDRDTERVQLEGAAGQGDSELDVNKPRMLWRHWRPQTSPRLLALHTNTELVHSGSRRSP